jgi:hypothetical protein
MRLQNIGSWWKVRGMSIVQLNIYALFFIINYKFGARNAPMNGDDYLGRFGLMNTINTYKDSCYVCWI